MGIGLFHCIQCMSPMVNIDMVDLDMDVVDMRTWCVFYREMIASHTILQRIPSPHGPDSRTLGLVCHDTQSFCAFPLKIAQLSYIIIIIMRTIPIGICMIFMITIIAMITMVANIILYQHFLAKS